jgi:hypothetical protein
VAPFAAVQTTLSCQSRFGPVFRRSIPTLIRDLAGGYSRNPFSKMKHYYNVGCVIPSEEVPNE